MIQYTEKTTASDISPHATLTLPLDLRQKSRQRVLLDSGEEAAVILKRGSTLHNNDLLISAVENGVKVVRVVAAEEFLSKVQCDDALLFARVCYHLGNRHMPLQIEEGCLYYLHDHVLDDMVRGLGLAVTHLKAPFEPEQGAYGDHSGSHSGHHYG